MNIAPDVETLPHALVEKVDACHALRGSGPIAFAEAKLVGSHAADQVPQVREMWN